MLGLIKPYKMELLVKDCTYYKLYYCSVCRHLVRNHSRAYAFINSYEGTLLAMIFNEMVVQDIEAVKDRCSGLPMVKVAALPPDHEAVQLGAAVSLLAFVIKSQDNLEDESGFWLRQYNGWIQRRLLRTFRKQRRLYDRFRIDLEYVEAEIQALHRLEQDAAVRDLDRFLDQWGAVFAHIMTQAFLDRIAKDRFEALYAFFHELGRVINLLDAMTDLHADHAAGRFNPILRAEPDLNLTDENCLQATYNKYLEKIQAGRDTLLDRLPALELRDSWPLVQNILSHSLDRESRKAFEAMVLQRPVTEKMFFNCKDF
ncbi:DUF5685 family protein [Nitrospina watsonii]|uniref:Uncharacterized protein n=1 Tax=Nitrospina watsonii TaxID=1323948 RepID=A0ABM9HCQ5_9BACT|nr:DUF5685 family protein [Nitrospina watsonii]CAI2717897.1 conserved protein of unknown function [Nitrospina watsonii]